MFLTGTVYADKSINEVISHTFNPNIENTYYPTSQTDNPQGYVICFYEPGTTDITFNNICETGIYYICFKGLGTDLKGISGTFTGYDTNNFMIECYENLFNAPNYNGVYLYHLFLHDPFGEWHATGENITVKNIFINSNFDEQFLINAYISTIRRAETVPISYAGMDANMKIDTDNYTITIIDRDGDELDFFDGRDDSMSREENLREFLYGTIDILRYNTHPDYENEANSVYLYLMSFTGQGGGGSMSFRPIRAYFRNVVFKKCKFSNPEGLINMFDYYPVNTFSGLDTKGVKDFSYFFFSSSISKIPEDFDTSSRY
jgi:hypothetical protein